MEEADFESQCGDKTFLMGMRRGATISNAMTPTVLGNRTSVNDPRVPKSPHFAVSPYLQLSGIGDTMGYDGDAYHLRYSYRPTPQSNKISDTRRFM